MSRTPSTGLRQLAIAFAALTVILLALAAATRNAHRGAAAVAADIGWFGFQISLLALIAVGLAAVGRAIRGRRRVAGR